MEEVAETLAPYATLLLAGFVIASLLALLLTWVGARRYGTPLATWCARKGKRVDIARLGAKLHIPAAWLSQPAALRNIFFWLPVACFAVILSLLFLFAELVDEIEPDEDLHLFDSALAEALRVHASPATDAFFEAATQLGNGATLTAVGIVVGLILLFRRQAIPFYTWVLAVAGSGLLNSLLKSWIERDRPPTSLLLETWSFPSGHAMNSLVTYGMLAYLLGRVVPPRWLTVVISGALVITLIVGASRLFLGLHYFSDVVAGFITGLAWLTACITVSELALERKRRLPLPK